MPQAIKHVYIADRIGHLVAGYYEDNVTSVITGFRYLNDGYPNDPLGAFVCGFPASMNGETVTLKLSGVATSLGYPEGQHKVEKLTESYDLTGVYLGDQYCLDGLSFYYPHTHSFPIGDGFYEITWKAHKFVVPIKVKSWINFSNCSH